MGNLSLGNALLLLHPFVVPRPGTLAVLSKIMGPAVHLALGAPRPREAYMFAQRLRNHYEMQQMAFSSGKIDGFPPWELLTFAGNPVICAANVDSSIPRLERIIAESYSGLFVQRGVVSPICKNPLLETPFLGSWGQTLKFQWNRKYGCKGTVTTSSSFALIDLVAWKRQFDSSGNAEGSRNP